MRCLLLRKNMNKEIERVFFSVESKFLFVVGFCGG